MSGTNYEKIGEKVIRDYLVRDFGDTKDVYPGSCGYKQFVLDMRGLADHFRIGEAAFGTVSGAILEQYYINYLTGTDNIAEVLATIARVELQLSFEL